MGLIKMISCDTDDVAMLFQNALNREKGPMAIDNILREFDHENLTVFICGYRLAVESFGIFVLKDYITYEGNRYNSSFKNVTQFSVENSKDTYDFEITMQSSMSFHETRRIKLRENKGRFQQIEISGSCVDSYNIDRSLMVNQWVPKLKNVNKTAKEFMKEVREKVPIHDEKFFHRTDIIFQKDRLHFNSRYFEWLKKFSRHFKHRNELFSSIVFENIDHIVFLTAHVFESIRNKDRTEVWYFFIEATCEQEIEEQWTIRQMHFRPEYNHHRNIHKLRAALMEELDFLIQEIEIISENRPNGNLYEIEKYGNALRFDNPELKLDYYSGTVMFMKVFEIPYSMKLEKCEKHLTEQGQDLTANMSCYYSYYLSGNQKLFNEMKFKITAYMDDFGIEALLWKITRVNEITVKYTPYSLYIYTDLGDKTFVINYNFHAIKAARIIIGQSSFEYWNWENNFKKLLGFIDNNDFSLKICGKTYKKNGAEFFKKYLERNRRTTKLSKFHTEVTTQNRESGIVFKIVYTSINSMGFFMTEIYTIDAEDTTFRDFQWESVEIEGACIYENLNIDFIHSKMSENTDLIKEINDFVSTIEFPYIGNKGSINLYTYSENFKGYIIANPEVMEVYQFNDFELYLHNFVETNKLRQKSSSTMIKIEQNSFVVKMSMIFDQFIFDKNQSSNDEWIFLIEGSRNSEERWEIKQLVMSPKLELLAENIIQRRAAISHVLNTEEVYSDVVENVKNMSRNSSHPKIDLDNCKTLTSDHTVFEFHKFLERFVEFLKLADNNTLTHEHKLPIWNSVKSFSFETRYEFKNSGYRQAFVVKTFAEYNFKHGFYTDVKVEITCPEYVFRPAGRIV
ncbi:unnamed protein product [Caenorhabditis angaria]|uniref:Uncharacterized protein n=1 Tax=Caenorhabditis angaria TaxID=860376 RepID=A0A9P1I785_9PELO|nr:unnamed protein product [Caenorhabditis angaria]